MCNITEIDIKVGNLKQQMKISCPNGAVGFQQGLLWMIFAPVLLVKVIG